MKKILNRVWYFIFIHLSILAGIDDFSCSEGWDNKNLYGKIQKYL